VVSRNDCSQYLLPSLQFSRATQTALWIRPLIPLPPAAIRRVPWMEFPSRANQSAPSHSLCAWPFGRESTLKLFLIFLFGLPFSLREPHAATTASPADSLPNRHVTIVPFDQGQNTLWLLRQNSREAIQISFRKAGRHNANASYLAQPMPINSPDRNGQRHSCIIFSIGCMEFSRGVSQQKCIV